MSLLAQCEELPCDQSDCICDEVFACLDGSPYFNIEKARFTAYCPKTELLPRCPWVYLAWLDEDVKQGSGTLGQCNGVVDKNGKLGIVITVSGCIIDGYGPLEARRDANAIKRLILKRLCECEQQGYQWQQFSKITPTGVRHEHSEVQGSPEHRVVLMFDVEYTERLCGADTP